MREGAARIGWGSSCGGLVCFACDRGYEGVCGCAGMLKPSTFGDGWGLAEIGGAGEATLVIVDGRRGDIFVEEEGAEVGVRMLALSSFGS